MTKSVPYAALIAGIFLLAASPVFAQVTYNFTNDVSAFDGSYEGVSDTITDGAFTFQLTTHDIVAEGTSNLIDGAEHRTNIGPRTGNTMGIRSDTESFDSPGQNFNPGEKWLFKFNQDLIFNSMDISSFTAGVDLRLTFFDGTNDGAGTEFLIGEASPTFNYEYSADTIAEFAFNGVGTTTDDVIRPGSLTVTAVPEAANAGMLLSIWVVLCALTRRNSANQWGRS